MAPEHKDGQERGVPPQSRPIGPMATGVRGRLGHTLPNLLRPKDV